MANDEHVAILRQGVEVWNRWRTENPEVEPDLNLTNLRAADLSGANLRLTDLNGADLTGADLSGSNLIFTILLETTFVNTNLTGASGLKYCLHLGPCFLDRSTLFISGNLPLAFLRGCGLSDWETEATKLHQPNLTPVEITNIIYEIHRLRCDHPIQYYSCFISYSHADKAFARKLYDALQSAGIRCWLDEHQMLPGDDIYEAVDRGIRLFDKVLLCCSEASLTSWWVDNEIDTAFEKERRLM